MENNNETLGMFARVRIGDIIIIIIIIESMTNLLMVVMFILFPKRDVMHHLLSVIAYAY